MHPLICGVVLSCVACWFGIAASDDSAGEIMDVELACVCYCCSKAEELIQQIVQSRSREIPQSVGNGAVSPSMNMSSGGSRMGDSVGNSGLPPSIPTVSTPTFTQVLMNENFSPSECSESIASRRCNVA